MVRDRYGCIVQLTMSHFFYNNIAINRTEKGRERKREKEREREIRCDQTDLKEYFDVLNKHWKPDTVQHTLMKKSWRREWQKKSMWTCDIW